MKKCISMNVTRNVNFGAKMYFEKQKYAEKYPNNIIIYNSYLKRVIFRSYLGVFVSRCILYFNILQHQNFYKQEIDNPAFTREIIWYFLSILFIGINLQSFKINLFKITKVSMFTKTISTILKCFILNRKLKAFQKANNVDDWNRSNL